MAVTESASQNTPLHLCAMNGYAKVAGVILEGSKASVDPVNKISKTPLLYACMEVKIKLYNNDLNIYATPLKTKRLKGVFLDNFLY